MIPEDRDATVDGVIITTLPYDDISDVHHASSEYLYWASDGTRITETSFSVDAVSKAQSISGTVTDGTSKPGIRGQGTQRAIDRDQAFHLDVTTPWTIVCDETLKPTTQKAGFDATDNLHSSDQRSAAPGHARR